MIGVSVLLFAAIAAYGWYLARSPLFPPTIFAGWWACIMVGLMVYSDEFYPVSETTIWVFIVGTVSFAVGGIVTLVIARTKQQTGGTLHYVPVARVRPVFVLGAIALIAAFPFYFRLISAIGDSASDPNFWRGLRRETSTDSERSFGIFAYVASFGTFLVLASSYENGWKGKKGLITVLVFVIAMAYHVLSTARYSALALMFALIAVAWIRAGRVRVKPMLLGIGVSVLMFSFLGALLKKGADLEAGWAANAESIRDSLRLYVLGGPVAFDLFIHREVEWQPGSHTFRFFARLLEAAGAEISVAPLIQNYAFVPEPTNVFTAYRPYYQDFGLPGVIVFMFANGLFSTVVYWQAIKGHRLSVVLFGGVFAAIVLSVANEQFVVASSWWLQLVSYYFLVYGAPSVARGFARRLVAAR